MSNIFAPLVRPFGTLPVELGSGPVVDGTEYMHMWIDPQGSLYVSNATIHHYGAAVPFDIDGRVVISTAPVVRWDQDIPFTASGAVAMVDGSEFAHWDQGLTFLESGHIATGDVAPPPTAPVWSEIPDKANYLYELPQDYDVSPYVSEAGDPITSYSLIGAPDFFTVDNAGVVTAGVGTADAAHLIEVEACNSLGCSSTTFTWDLSTGNVPTWETIPNQEHRQNELPKTLDVKPYASSDSGPILTYSLVTPPAGITMANGVVTVAAGSAVGSYDLTVRATNGVGAGDTVFNWTVLETLTGPQWSTIPNQTNVQGDLPQVLDTSPYVTSNAGGLRNWLLITAPAGFTIDQAGVVTASAGVVIADHTVVVQVENDVGSASTSFQWTVTENLLPPQWQTIPPASTREDLLPAPYDVSPYASSNSGPLVNWALVAAPAGFTINSVNGVVTAAAGIAPGTYPLTARVTNDTGTTDSAPFNWEIELFYLPPLWSTIDPRTTGEDALPSPYNVSSFVTSNHGSLVGWALVAPPAGFTIDTGGIITAEAGLAVDTYALTVDVSNDTGSSASDPFDWEITLFYLPPQWSTIPDQSNGDDELPETLDVAPYVTSNSGPLTGWTLVTPPAGFSIDAAGVITVAFGTTPGNYNVTASVDNDEGTGTSEAFAWTISSVLLPPQWSTIPDQTTGEDILPATLDAALYVTSNSGTLTGWALVSPPAGFSIDAAGLVTAAAGISPAGYSLQVRVTNDTGTEDSNVFNWQIDSVFLVPQWTDINNKGADEDNLPSSKNTSTSVTSNHGALFGWTILNPTAGFSINTSGKVTAADGTAPDDYYIQVQVSNSSGSSQMTDNGWAPWRFRIRSVYLPPQWSIIPDQSTEEQLLPVALDVEPYVTSNHGLLTNWSLVSPPGGFTIDQNGVVSVSAGRPVGDHSVTARASNDSGSADSAAFTWSILEEPLVPQWTTIPNQQTRENLLPQSFSVAGYATSNAGSLTSWALVTPPTGFSIDSAGLITVAAGTTVAIHPLTVRVSNDVGSNDSAQFTWEVQEELLLPQWSTVPGRSDRINTLPQAYGMSPYVTSNAGTLILWRLSSSPAGFSIDSGSGVITATAGAGVGDHSLRVGVTNSIGESLSNTFQWEILEELLPPQWSTIPPKTTAAEDLADTYDVSPYVTSNSGPLDTWSLITPPAGFSINQSGVITAATNAATDTVHSITAQVFNDTGSAQQSFNWTIDAPLAVSYYHEFNADLGGFTFTRGSNATWVRDGNSAIWDTVGVDAPVYADCNFNGSIYTPTVGFTGLVLERTSSNRIKRSISHDNSYWSHARSTSNPPQVISLNNNGAIWRVESEWNSADMAFSMDLRQGTCTNIYWGGTENQDPYWVAFDITASYARYYFNPTLPSSRATFMSGAGTTGNNKDWDAIHYQAEFATYFLEATSRIVSDSGAVTTRAEAGIKREVSTMGMTPSIVASEHAGQIKVYLDTTITGGTHYIASLTPTGSSSEYAFLLEGSSSGPSFKIHNKYASNSTTITHNYTWSSGELVDFRWSVKPGRRLKFWVNGVAVGTQAAALGSYNTDPSEVRVGDIFGDSFGGVRLYSFRLVQGDVSDAEVEAWP